jgi:two-component system, NtrC family, sensor kinase
MRFSADAFRDGSRSFAGSVRFTMASLFVIRGRDQGKHYQLTDSPLRIGRESGNTVQLHDTEVSRHHAEIQHHDGQFYLVDHDSSNGTFVNSNRVERHLLANGDRVQLGRTLMLFTSSEESSPFDASSVDIVRSSPRSHIVKSITQEEGSRLFQPGEASESPWLARARSNLQVMYRTALAVSHTLDIDELLHRILELIFEWVEADRGCIMLVDQETEELTPAARRNRQAAPARNPPPRASLHRVR